MKRSFQNINSIDDIRKIIKSASSKDGEFKDFELKGSSNSGIFTKEVKQNLAKEICAFANTYGGTLIYHKGDNLNIIPFSDDEINTLALSFESWLVDSLEPKLSGIEFKIVENAIAIKIVESKTKPHRTSGKKKDYFFRHLTQSIPMPEIMIASMYRSQEYLDYSFNTHFERIDNSLYFKIQIVNNSRISGTKPKVRMQIYCMKQFFIELHHPQYLEHTFSKHTFQVPKALSNYNLYGNGFFETSQKFTQQILYPKDKIEMNHMTKPNEKINEHEYYLVVTDCCFLESVRKSETKLIRLFRQNVVVVEESDEWNSLEVINRFIEVT